MLVAKKFRVWNRCLVQLGDEKIVMHGIGSPEYSLIQLTFFLGLSSSQEIKRRYANETDGTLLLSIQTQFSPRNAETPEQEVLKFM